MERQMDFAANLGIAIKGEFQPNALGGTTEEFSTLDVAGAYAAFGNQGIYTKPHAVTKVVYRDGTEMSLKPEKVVAMKDSTAYMVTDILRDVLTVGTGKRANISGLDIAGKTGTTNNAYRFMVCWLLYQLYNCCMGRLQDRTPMGENNGRTLCSPRPF